MIEEKLDELARQIKNNRSYQRNLSQRVSTVERMFERNFEDFQENILKQKMEIDRKRMDALYTQFIEYTSGVERVYDEFIKIKSLIESDGIKNKITHLEELKREIENNNKYIEKPEVRAIYEFMKNFQNTIEDLLDKINNFKHI